MQHDRVSVRFSLFFFVEWHATAEVRRAQSSQSPQTQTSVRHDRVLSISQHVVAHGCLQGSRVEVSQFVKILCRKHEACDERHRTQTLNSPRAACDNSGMIRATHVRLEVMSLHKPLPSANAGSQPRHHHHHDHLHRPNEHPWARC